MGDVAAVAGRYAGRTATAAQTALTALSAPARRRAWWTADRALLLGVDGVVVLTAVALAPADRVVSVAAALLVALFAAFGLYRTRLVPSWLDDLPLLLLAGLASVGSGAAVGAGTGELPRCLLLVTAVLAARSVSYLVLAVARRAGVLVRRAVVVGCGDLGAQLIGILQRPEFGTRVVGFVDDDPRLPEAARPLPVIGVLDDLPDLIRRHALDTVVVGWSNAPEPVIVDVIRACDRLPVEIYAVPRFWQVQSVSRAVETIRGVPLGHLRRPAFRAATWPVKRVLDVVVAAAALLLLSPVLLACAVAVRLEGGPGVLFRQTRIGLDGREFQVLKFRSMRPTTGDESATLWNIGGDSRVGRVGRLLRRTSADELPQLWNVVRGEMSLVGPRPERPHFVERFSSEHDEYLWRHRVPCGVTGWAQVNGLRGDTSIAERARFDNFYIENWSLWLDVKILLRTVVQVITAAGR